MKTVQYRIILSSANQNNQKLTLTVTCFSYNI